MSLRLRAYPAGTIVPCIAMLFMFISSGVFAQSPKMTLTGKITDAVSNEPLPGARIAVVGKHSGAIAGFDGSYKLSLDPGDYSLKITYVGYRDTVVKITATEGRQTLDLALQRVETKEVTVNAKTENGSEASAVITVRNAETMINAVSARTIEVSPDLDVADVAQRLSAVSLTRDATGEAQYAIIRGMDRRYNYTTVDGIKVPSPNDQDRYVPLDIFPSELLDRLEVTKTLLPTMEGDAIGGTMNIVMKQAPDEFVLNASAGTGYDGLYFTDKFTSFDYTPASQSPRIANGSAYNAQPSDFPLAPWNYSSIAPHPNEYATLTIGDRFLDDKNLGVIVSGSYQNIAKGATGTFFDARVDAATNDPVLKDIENRVYSTYQTRDGAMMNADYEIDDANKISLFGMLVGLQQQEVRDQSDTSLENDWSGPGTGDINYQRRTTIEEQTIGNVTLSGDHSIFGKNLEADWKLVYSKATFNEPDQATLISTAPADSAFKIDDNAGETSRIWSNNTDEDKSAYLNLKTTENLFGTPTEFTYGGMYREKDRVSNYDVYYLNPSPTVQVYNGNILQNSFSVQDPLGTSSDALDYTAHEDITAGFAQAKFQIGNLQTIGGLRAEYTDYGWVTGLPANTTFSGRTGELTYLDYLPSVSFKYDATDNQDWRLSYYRAISRPQFLEVIPYNIQGDDYNQEGNPNLQRTTADNYDIRWEYFPGGLDQIIVGAFFKSIYNPIEYTLQVTTENTYLIPENYGRANNYGLEIDLTKYFSDFGIRGNYTYTNSAITTLKRVDYDSAGISNSRQQLQTRPLEGQSSNIGNLSLLYKNFESGTDASISAVYTGQSIVTVSPYYDNDIWQKGIFQLDLSGEQRIAGQLSIYFKVTNLLNTQLEQYIPSPYVNNTAYSNVTLQTPGQNILIRMVDIDRTYVLGVRFKL